MKSGTKNCGFTLVELVLVVALIVILASMVLAVARRINDQAKERLCRDTLVLIDNALEQFRDFGYEYKGSYAGFGFTFPLDCTGFTSLELEPRLGNALNTTINILPDDPTHDPNYSGSEALYFLLSQIPDCRPTLDKIDKTLMTNKCADGITDITVTTPSGTYPFMRIIDPWKMPLRYYYYDRYPSLLPNPDTKKTFPIITSAGADKKFGTNDDITNRQGK